MRHSLWMLTMLGGCGGKLLTIPISSSSETVIPQGSLLEDLIGGLGFAGFADMDFTTSTELENQGVEPGDITEVFLDELTLTVTDPEGGDLAFIETLSFSVGAPGLDEVRIASQDSFPDGQSTVAMVLDDVDLTDYVVSQSMSFITDASGTRPSDDTTVLAEFTLKVGATRQGIFNQLKKN